MKSYVLFNQHGFRANMGRGISIRDARGMVCWLEEAKWLEQNYKNCLWPNGERMFAHDPVIVIEQEDDVRPPTQWGFFTCEVNSCGIIGKIVASDVDSSG